MSRGLIKTSYCVRPTNNPVVNLWLSVILLAIRDFRGKNLTNRGSAQDFLFGNKSILDEVCEVLNLDVEFLRKNILTFTIKEDSMDEINENYLAQKIAEREGGNFSVGIGQIKEILKITLEIMATLDGEQVEELLNRHRNCDK